MLPSIESNTSHPLAANFALAFRNVIGLTDQTRSQIWDCPIRLWIPAPAEKLLKSKARSKQLDMPQITISLPSSLKETIETTAAERGVALDSFVGFVLCEFLETYRHRMFQISTSGALVEGVVQGTISSKELLQHGNFGLGTFQNLNGEMVILDGAIYQALGDGSINLRRDDFNVPYASIANYQPDLIFNTREIASLSQLEKICDPYRESDNLFYALRVDGLFSTMHTRAVMPTQEGMTLVQAAEIQSEFHFADIEGTLVCIWSPPYSKSFSVSGYHFHFISEDRLKGGHVLACSAKSLRVGIQMLFEFAVRLPDTGPFLKTDLSHDPAEALRKAESRR